MGEIDADERTNRRGFGREWNGEEGMKGYDFDGRKKERERLERREQPPALSLSPRFLNSDSWTNDQSDGEKLQTNPYLGL